MKKFLLVIALACTTTLPYLQAQEAAQAPERIEQQDKKRKHHRPKLSPEHRAELKAHFQNTMLPVLTEKHAAFDAQLSASDLQYLNSKRAVADQIREQKKAIHQERKALREEEKSREEIQAIIQPKMDGIRQQHEALAEEMQPFIERNQELINTTMEEMKPYRQQWKAERKAIHEKYRPEDAPRPEDRKKEGKDCDKDKGDKEEKRAKRKERRVMKFLLWNGENPEEEMESMEESSFGAFDVETSMDVFPNPAKDQTTVNFELNDAAQDVNVMVSDINGRVVRQVNLGKLNAGKHNTTIPVNDLTAGQYIYTLDIDGQQQTKTVIVQH